MEVCDEFSICWAFPPLQRMLQVMQVGSTHPQSNNLQSLPDAGLADTRQSKHLHWGRICPVQACRYREEPLCSLGWELLAERCLKQRGCNMVCARLQTFLGQLSRTRISSGCMYRTPYNVGPEGPGGCTALPLCTHSLKGFLQAQMSPSVPVSIRADQVLLCIGELIS